MKYRLVSSPETLMTVVIMYRPMTFLNEPLLFILVKQAVFCSVAADYECERNV